MCVRESKKSVSSSSLWLENMPFQLIKPLLLPTNGERHYHNGQFHLISYAWSRYANTGQRERREGNRRGDPDLIKKHASTWNLKNKQLQPLKTHILHTTLLRTLLHKHEELMWFNTILPLSIYGWMLLINKYNNRVFPARTELVYTQFKEPLLFLSRCSQATNYF